MITKIPMPSGGTNTDRLRILSWKKAVGDAVSRGDVLLEVETDKAVLEVESFAKGTLLKQAIPAGEFAVVGEVIAYIGNPDDAGDLNAPAAAQQSAQSAGGQPAPERPSTPDRAVPSPAAAAARAAQATPAAKKAMRELGLSMAAVQAEIGKEVLSADDVAQFAARHQQDPSLQAAPFDLQPLTAMRRGIAERMRLGASIPTFTAEIEIEAGECMRRRSQINARQDGVKVAYHDIIAKGVALLCPTHPLINASFTDEGIRVFRTVNVGIAVSMAEGLVVPVVEQVEQKTLLALAAENARNIEQARDGKINAALLRNGTVTISNLGGYAIPRFTAILNPPQSCILAVGAIGTRAVRQGDAWREVPMMSIAGTFDHRLVDGAYGARFLRDLKGLLEHPQRIFSDLRDT